MSTIRVPDEAAVELVELLSVVAELCVAQQTLISMAMSHFLGLGYGAGDMHDDAERLAAVMARAVGLTDAVTGRAR